MSATVRTSGTRRLHARLRLFHLLLALAVGTYVYAPDKVSDPMRPLMMFVLIPLTGLTGLMMWKPAWFRWLPGGAGRRQGGSPEA